VIYLIYCKNFGKCHNVPPAQKIERKPKTRNNKEASHCAGMRMQEVLQSRVREEVMPSDSTRPDTPLRSLPPSCPDRVDGSVDLLTNQERAGRRFTNTAPADKALGRSCSGVSLETEHTREGQVHGLRDPNTHSGPAKGEAKGGSPGDTNSHSPQLSLHSFPRSRG
jgi:hypothetical protein